MLACILKPIFMKRTFILLLFSACISFSVSAQVTILPYGLDITNDDVSQLSIDYQSTAGTHDWWLNFYGHLLMRNNEFGNFAANEYWHFGARNTGNLDIAFGTASGTNIINATNAIMTFTQEGDIGIGTNSPAKKLEVDGDVRISNSSNLSADLEIITSGANSTAAIKMGAGGSATASLNYNSTNEVLRLSPSISPTSNNDVLNMAVGNTNTGHLGLNTLPTEDRFIINHNSGSGVHLNLRENNNSDFARQRFSNFNIDSYWDLAARGDLSVSDPARFNIYYYNGTSGTNLLSVDGEEERIGLRKVNPASDFHIRQNASNNITTGIRLEDNDGTYWNVWVDNLDDYLFNNDGTGVAQIEDGTGNYQAFSDRRLKSNIESMESVLSEVKDLRPVWYTFNADEKQKKTLGFIAQEVEEVLPDFVDTEKEYYALTYDYFGVLAIKAIQEQQEIIEEKEDRIRDLEQRLADLEETLERVVQHVELPSEQEAPIILTDAKLGQNEPNPSLGTTRIPFTIPTSARSATLRVTASNGQLIREIAIDQRGRGQLTLQTGQLSPAAYQYTLWIDGQAVATRQMLIQK